jgi:hypothetical protein
MPSNAFFYEKMSKKVVKFGYYLNFYVSLQPISNTVSSNTLNLLTLNFIIR